MADRNNAMTEAPRVEEIRELTGDELESVAGGFDLIGLLYDAGKAAAKFVWKTITPP